ncbi:TetR/AcrR family transcriptional regulator [Nocardia sp. NBC_01377]|uniref:TetR/AcrR family transcriptional regulator n=1 Tax=Nocardia sp. NBC_01377 TaxID=2903595 RepID=UPI00325389CD
MAESETRNHRATWDIQAPPLEPRDRIIAAASRCLAAVGLERTSISAIAREARMSRQTVYNHFETKQEIVQEALTMAASAAAERIIAAARMNTSAAGFVVELCLSALREYSLNPAISPVISFVQGDEVRRRILSPHGLATARHFVEPVLSYVPEREHDLDEMTETLLRFVLSLLTLESGVTRSQDALRSYLHRVLVPALGLEPDPAYDGT